MVLQYVEHRTCSTLESLEMPLYRTARFLLILLAICNPHPAGFGPGHRWCLSRPARLEQLPVHPRAPGPFLEQIGALEAAHSNYLESMMNLRDGAIAEFMEDHEH